MTGSERVANAQEFLASARKRKVTELPPSVLMREDAELRRQLGVVLDLIGEASEVLGRAFADAIGYREPPSFCEFCSAHAPELGELCDEHAADALLVGAYVELAAELGIEVPR